MTEHPPGTLGILAALSAFGPLVIPNSTALALTGYPHAAGSGSALLGASRFASGAAAAPLVGGGAVAAVAVARRTAAVWPGRGNAIGSRA